MNFQFSVTEKLQTLQMFITQINALGPCKCQLTLQMFQSLTNIVNEIFRTFAKRLKKPIFTETIQFHFDNKCLRTSQMFENKLFRTL
jgi:hypothetical protein